MKRIVTESSLTIALTARKKGRMRCTSLRDVADMFALLPAINRWAILECPSGTARCQAQSVHTDEVTFIPSQPTPNGVAASLV